MLKKLDLAIPFCYKPTGSVLKWRLHFPGMPQCPVYFHDSSMISDSMGFHFSEHNAGYNDNEMTRYSPPKSTGR